METQETKEWISSLAREKNNFSYYSILYIATLRLERLFVVIRGIFVQRTPYPKLYYSCAKFYDDTHDFPLASSVLFYILVRVPYLSQALVVQFEYI